MPKMAFDLNEKLRLQVVLNPKRFYLSSPITSNLILTDDQLTFRTGKSLWTVKRDEIETVFLERTNGIIQLKNRTEKIVFAIPSTIAHGSFDFEATNWAVEIIRTGFINGLTT